MRRWVNFDVVEALINHEGVMDMTAKITKRDASVRTAKPKDIIILTQYISLISC